MRFLKMLALAALALMPVRAMADTTTSRLSLTIPTTGSFNWALKADNNFYALDTGTFFLNGANVMTGGSAIINAGVPWTFNNSSITLTGVNGNVNATNVNASVLDGNFINVMSPPFNAKCDGTTHDDAAFAMAIATAAAQFGGTIIVPWSANPCIVAGNPGINIQSNHIHIKGVGYGWSEVYTPQIEYVGTSTAIVIGGSGQATDTQLENLHILGTSAAKGSGIDFEGTPAGDLECIQCTLDRVSVSGFVSTNTAGLFLNAGTLNTFKQISSFANYYGVYISSLGNVTATHFDGISVRVNKSYGFYANQNTGFVVDGLSLFESNGDSGIALMGAAATANYSMFFHDFWMEGNLTNYSLGTTTGAYQFQFLTNPASPNQGLLRNVMISNVVCGTSHGKGDIDIANADNVTVSGIAGGAGVSSDVVKVELTATNVSLFNIDSPSAGNVDILQRAAFNLSSGTLSMYGSITTTGTITAGTSGIGEFNASSSGGDGNTVGLNLIGGVSNASWSIFTNNSSFTGVASDLCIRKNTAGNGTVGCKINIAANGDVGIFGLLAPIYPLDVNGMIHSNNGLLVTYGVASSTANIGGSTFDATGNLFIASGSSITLSGSGGFITSGSSITASAFYGNGAHITNVTATTDANLTGDITSVGNATTAAATQANIKTLSNSAGLTVTYGVTAGSATFGTTDLVTDAADHRVGIGTANPGTLLDLYKAAGGEMFAIEGSGTNTEYMIFGNTGGTAYFGLESSAGGQIITGDTAYALAITAPVSQVLQLGYSGGTGVSLTIGTTGLVTLAKESPYAGSAACYTTGGLMGHCTTVVGATGLCTCSAP